MMNGESCDTPDNETAAQARRDAWDAVIREAVHVSADTSVPDNLGLAHVLARIEADRRAAAAPRQAEARPGWLARIGRSLSLSHGLAVACLMVLVQGGIIIHLWPGETPAPEFAIVRALPGDAGGHEPFIRVAFRPDSTEQALRTLLNRVQADVVAGPTQLGDYYLLVPAGRATAAAEQLRTSQIVEGVELVSTLPGGN